MGSGSRSGTDSRSRESGDGGCHGEDQGRADHGRSRKTDFEVREDGAAQKIALFSRDELPPNVALVLDVSDSIGPFLGPLQEAAKTTLAALKAEDQVALFTFFTDAELRVPLTKDKAQVAGQFATFKAGGATNINDGIFAAAQYLLATRPKGAGGKGILSRRGMVLHIPTAYTIHLGISRSGRIESS